MTDPRIAQLRGCYTSIINDVLRARGCRDFNLPARIAPLQPELTVCGPAWTVEGREAADADAHETLLAWTGLLSKARPGHLWVAQPNTAALAQMGELSAETLHAKGVLGCVLDGALRDSNFILELGLPCWRTHHTPRDIVGSWLPVATEVPLRFDEVLVRPGDWLHGDRDGMVRIKAEMVDEVLAEALEAMRTESKVRVAIRAGEDPQQAYLKHRKF